MQVLLAAAKGKRDEPSLRKPWQGNREEYRRFRRDILSSTKDWQAHLSRRSASIGKRTVRNCESGDQIVTMMQTAEPACRYNPPKQSQHKISFT